MSVPSSPRQNAGLNNHHSKSMSMPTTMALHELENAVLKPEQAFFNPEAQRISDAIDEQLKVERLTASALPLSYMNTERVPSTTRSTAQDSQR